MRKYIISVTIWFILKFPGLMQSDIFKRMMVTFHGKMADRFSDIMEEQKDYEKPIEEGLNLIKKNFTSLQRILDIGTGTGFAVFKVEEFLEPEKIWGIDLSDEMLAVAEKNLQKKSTNKSIIKFEKQDASDLDFNDDFFDLVVGSNVPFSPHEIKRVLNKDGLFLFTLSLGGDVIVSYKKKITKFLSENGFKLEKIVKTGKGAYILSSKQ